MMALPLDVRFADDYITIGPVALRPKGTTVAALVRLLGAPPDRTIALELNTVYIYDVFGLRFWAKEDIISELQFVFETKEGRTLPIHPFAGPLEYQGKVLIPPVAGTLFTHQEIPGFVQDTDPLQYGLLVYDAKLPRLTYSAILSKRTGNLQYLSVL